MGSLGALPSFGACMASSGKACGYAALGRERGAWRECVTRAYTDKRLAAFVAEPTHWVRPQCPQRSGSRVPERMPAKVRLVCLCVCLFVSGACALGCLIDAGLPWNVSRRALADDEARPEYPAVPQSYASLQTAQCAACAAGLEIKSIGFKSI